MMQTHFDLYGQSVFSFLLSENKRDSLKTKLPRIFLPLYPPLIGDYRCIPDP